MALNPFTPGPGSQPPVLAGRDGLVRDFVGSLDTRRPLAIIGLRGTGKTVLLRKFEEFCDDLHWLPLRLELNRRHSRHTELVDHLLYYLAARAAALESRYPRTMDLISKLQRQDEGAEGRPPREHMVDACRSLLEKSVAAGFEGVVLLLDEFQFLRDDTDLGHFSLSTLLEAVTSLQQDHAAFQLVVSGLPELRRNLTEAKTYAERMFTFRELSYLEPTATREAIAVPLERGSLRFSDALIDRLVADTMGYPYFVQFFPFFIIENVPRPPNLPSSVIDLDAYRAIKPLLLDELDAQFYGVRLERASEEETDLLLHLAPLGSPFELRLALADSRWDRNRVNQMLMSLRDKEIVLRIGRGRYGYALPLFDDFLRRERERDH